MELLTFYTSLVRDGDRAMLEAAFGWAQTHGHTALAATIVREGRELPDSVLAAAKASTGSELIAAAMLREAAGDPAAVLAAAAVESRVRVLGQLYRQAPSTPGLLEALVARNLHQVARVILDEEHPIPTEARVRLYSILDAAYGTTKPMPKSTARLFVVTPELGEEPTLAAAARSWTTLAGLVVGAATVTDDAEFVHHCVHALEDAKDAAKPSEGRYAWWGWAREIFLIAEQLASSPHLQLADAIALRELLTGDDLGLYRGWRGEGHALDLLDALLALGSHTETACGALLWSVVERLPARVWAPYVHRCLGGASPAAWAALASFQTSFPGTLDELVGMVLVATGEGVPA